VPTQVVTLSLLLVILGALSLGVRLVSLTPLTLQLQSMERSP
jgi:hypothetical protein